LVYIETGRERHLEKWRRAISLVEKRHIVMKKPISGDLETEKNLIFNALKFQCITHSVPVRFTHLAVAPKMGRVHLLLLYYQARLNAGQCLRGMGSR
jgi:hypothetical protein